MTKLRKVVLDVLKPHSPDIATLAKKIADIEGIDGVNISVYEIDKEVENVKITVIGKFENLSDIRGQFRNLEAQSTRWMRLLLASRLSGRRKHCRRGIM